MPNYCDNNLKISGEVKEVKKFINDFWVSDEHSFLMESILPQPAMINNEWHQWRISNWGCKWDISCSDTLHEIEAIYADLDEEDIIEVSLSYETPWSPNEPFVKHVSSIYKDLTFRLEYYECGMAFIGISIYEDGRQQVADYIEGRDTNSFIEYYSLAIDLGFEDADYIVNEMELDNITVVNAIAEKYDIEIEEPSNVIDITDELILNNIPKPE